MKRAHEQSRKRIKFRELGKQFLDDWASVKKSEQTWFAPMVHRLTEVFGGTYLDKIDHPTLVHYVTRRSKKTSPATVNHEIRFLKNMFNRAIEWKYLEINPAKRINRLKEPPPKERYLTQDESDRLVGIASEHLRPVVQTALLTGMRLGELLGLTWDRVYLDRKMIYLEHTKSGDPRWVAMADDLVDLFKTLPRKAHGHVFEYNGKPIASVKRSWGKARTKALIPEARFHDLRHTWASRMVERGVDLYTLMELGGWKSITMVRRYAHFAPEHKIKTAQLVNGTAGRVASLVASPLSK